MCQKIIRTEPDVRFSISISDTYRVMIRYRFLQGLNQWHIHFVLNVDGSRAYVDSVKLQIIQFFLLLSNYLINPN